MRTAVKILDVADPAAGTVPMFFENLGGESFCASLTPEQALYFKARLEAVCDKLHPAEKPFE